MKYRQLPLTICLIAVFQASFAQAFRQDWEDLITVNPTGGTISDVVSTGDVQTVILPEVASTLAISAKLTNRTATQCDGKAVITSIDAYTLPGVATCVGRGSISFTYTTNNGKHCRFHLEDGSLLTEASVVSADCSYTMATKQHAPVIVEAPTPFDAVFGIANPVITDGRNVQQIAINDPSFQDDETDISHL